MIETNKYKIQILFCAVSCVWVCLVCEFVIDKLIHRPDAYAHYASFFFLKKKKLENEHLPVI